MSDVGLDTKGAEISVEGDKVVVSGDALTKEEHEKVVLACDNLEGVAAVKAGTSGDPVSHTVDKCDTLRAISVKILGNGTRYKEVFEFD